MTRDQVTARLTDLSLELRVLVVEVGRQPDMLDAELAEAIGCLVTGLTSLARVLTRAGDDPQ